MVGRLGALQDGRWVALDGCLVVLVVDSEVRLAALVVGLEARLVALVAA